MENVNGFKSTYRVSQQGSVALDSHDDVIFQAVLGSTIVHELNRIVFAGGWQVAITTAAHRYVTEGTKYPDRWEFARNDVPVDDLQTVTDRANFKPLTYELNGTAADMKQTTLAIRYALGHLVQVDTPNETTLLVRSLDASPANALLQIMHVDGFAPDDVIVVGNDANVLPLFDLSGRTFAVGQADAAVVQAAHQKIGSLGELIERSFTVAE